MKLRPDGLAAATCICASLRLCVEPLSRPSRSPASYSAPRAHSTMQDTNLKPALPGALQGVGIDQKLDQQVPLDLMFRDEAGRDVPLSTFFNAASR